VIFVTALVVLRFTDIDKYKILPGDAQNVAPLLHVTGVDTDKHPDQLMLTDIYLEQATALSYLLDGIFHPSSEYISLSQLVPAGVPASEYDDQAFLDMKVSKDNARAAGLRALGWRVAQHHDGALVYFVSVPSPANTSGLHVGDIVTAVGDTSVSTACDLDRVTAHTSPGTMLHVRLRRAHFSHIGDVSYSTPVVCLRDD
jgi:PDZ domain-containing secreted protein